MPCRNLVAQTNTYSVSLDGVDDYIILNRPSSVTTNSSIYGSFKTGVVSALATSVIQFSVGALRYCLFVTSGFFTVIWDGLAVTSTITCKSNTDYVFSIVKISANTVRLTVNGVSEDLIPVSSYSGGETDKVQIGRNTYGGGISYVYFNGTFFSAYIKNGEDTILNFVPQANGALLETVNNVSYSNAGTGSFGVKQLTKVRTATTVERRPAEEGYSLVADGLNDRIDTGVIIDPLVDKVEFTFKYNRLGSTGIDQYFGSANGTKRFYFGQSSLGFRFAYGNNIVDSAIANNLNKNTVVLEGGKAYLNDILIADKSAEVNSKGTLPFILFAVSTGTGISACSAAELFSCKIWQSGVLTRDFVPQADGTLLDIVNNVSYGNEGSGAFGVNQETKVRSLAGIENTYSISSDGVDDYIDTGIKPNNKTRVEVTFRLNSLVVFKKIFGSRNVTSDYFFFGLSSVSWLWYAIANSSTAALKNFGAADNNKHHFVLDAKNGKVVMDGVETAIDVDTFSVLYNIFLYSDNITGSSTNHSYCTVYGFKIYQDDVLVQDLVPQSNGTFLDTVTGATFGNAGVGNLSTEQLTKVRTVITC